MDIVIASANKGKIEEIKLFFPEFKIIGYEELLGKLEIEENGKTFEENALIKARAIGEKFPEKIVLADDSGISIEALNNEPNIFSARYAGKNATSNDNVQKVVNELEKRSLQSSKAFYTCVITVGYKNIYKSATGLMHGKVCTNPKGNKGFGYDPIFIPRGFSQTLGEIADVKSRISHRAKALKQTKEILKEWL